MRIHNLYAGPHGETHFRDVAVECTDARPWVRAPGGRH
jgi:hypothetical protein